MREALSEGILELGAFRHNAPDVLHIHHAHNLELQLLRALTIYVKKDTLRFMFRLDSHFTWLKRYPLGLGAFPSAAFGFHDTLDHSPSDLQLIVVGKLILPVVPDEPVPLEVLLKLIFREL